MKDKDIPWLNCRYVVDGQYVHMNEAPILTKMIQQNGNFFFDDQSCYCIEKCFIKKWPNWRNKLRIDYESRKTSGS